MVKATILLAIYFVSATAAVAATGPIATDVAAQTDQTGIEPETVVMSFHVREDGSAHARVEHRLRLGDSNSTAAFERIRRDVAENSSKYVDRFGGRVRGTAATAENATGRPMSVENVTVETSVEQLPRASGVVTYSFTWHGFAETDGSRLVVGDALAGLYLDADTRLLISWPEGYESTSVGANVHERRERGAVWVGPRYFGVDGPSVVLQPSGAGGWLGSSNVPLAAAILVGLLALGGGTIWWRRGGSTHRRVTRQATPSDHRSPPPAPTDESPDEPLDGERATDDATEASERRVILDAESMDLLSNEEQVLLVLEENDGRVKQQAVVEALDWSEAKVSRVVGRLRDEERIETFRLGNENVLSLPGEGFS